MNRIHSITWITLLGCASPAFGQTTGKSETPASTARTDVAVCDVHFLHKSSDLIGADVRNAQDEDLGKIEELVMDPETGRIAYAVLSFGGFLGMGDKLFALPWGVLQLVHDDGNADDHNFLLGIDKERLKQSPGFPKSNWPDINSPEWTQSIDEFYAEELRARGVTAEASAKETEKAIDQSKRLALLKASDVDGCKVETSDGKDGGKIRELAVDPVAGRVNYVVLASGGFLGMGASEYALPWDVCQFTFNDDNDLRCKLTIAEAKFENAPTFKDDDWKRMSDRVFVKDVYTFYGCPCYWPENKQSSNTGK
jgi:sporulation protein YlmC with PRC-barrel domain